MSEPAVSREIVICATQRCGSTLLCNDLANNGLGRPEELFLPVINNFEAHKDRDIMPDVIRRGSSENGVFAVKIMANYAPVIEDYLARQCGNVADPQGLTHIATRFAAAYWIFISRCDTVSQAVSRLMSQITGINHAVLDRESEFVPGRAMVGSSENYNADVNISDSQIRSAMAKIGDENRSWEQFFVAHGIRPRRIVYEDTLADFSHIAAIRRDLNLPESPIVETRNLLKLGNKRSDEIVAAFKMRQGEKAVANNPENPKAVNLGIDVASVQKISQRWVATPYYGVVEPHAAGQWKSLIAPFLKPFDDIDQTHVLEIAVGHGRMTKILLDASQRVTGVDVLQENIDFCAERFKGEDRLRLIRTDGATLKEIADESITFAFCFDSMVHFDSDVVRSYIRECRRVLKPGGYFFTHHSNFTRNPEGDFQRAPHARNFMSEGLFRHYAKKEGMTVAATRIIDWGGGDKRVEALDCLSLLKKPAA